MIPPILHWKCTICFPDVARVIGLFAIGLACAWIAAIVAANSAKTPARSVVLAPGANRSTQGIVELVGFGSMTWTYGPADASDFVELCRLPGSWSRRHAECLSDIVQDCQTMPPCTEIEVELVECGVPARGFYYVMYHVTSAGPTSPITQVRGAIATSWRGGSLDGRLVVPYGIFACRLCVSASLWGAGVGTCITLMRWIVKYVRQQRGRCAQCGYPVSKTQNTCPECGTRVLTSR